jgi:hypothetical protein
VPQVKRAVGALLKHLAATAPSGADGRPADLLGRDERLPIHLSLHLKKLPGRASNKPLRMCVPPPALATIAAEAMAAASFRTGGSLAICRDAIPNAASPSPPDSRPVRSPIPHSLLRPEEGVECCLFVKDPSDEFAEKLAAAPVPGFTRVIGVSKLRSDFKQFKDRLALVGGYDAFFADERVVRMMPSSCWASPSSRARSTPRPCASTAPAGRTSSRARATPPT